MNKRSTAGLLATVFFAVLLPTGAPAAADEFLVDVQYVNDRVNDPSWRIVDVRSPAAYARGHIDGAVNIAIDEFFDSPPRDDLIAPLDKIQRVLGSNGIDNSISVVFYDRDEFYDAARAYWVLEVYGHSKVRMLDGGFAAWQSAQLPVSTQISKPQPRTFVPSVAPNRLATKLSTRLSIDNPNVVLVDARSRPEYDARVTHGARYGHIPTAVSYPTDEVFVEIDGVKIMKPMDSLRQVYAALPRDRKVITYCNIGKKSALVYFNLRRLGYDAANYDGSWHEWSADRSLPIEPDGGQAK